MSYSIKNLKTGPSREWGAKGSFTCTLYNGSKRVATVYEAGDGGELQVSYIGAREVEVTTKHGYKRNVTQGQLDLINFVKGKTYEFDGETCEHDIPSYLFGLVEKYELEKQVKGWCRTKIVIRVEGGEEGSYLTYKAKFTERNKEALLKKRSDIIEFVNERFGKAMA